MRVQQQQGDRGCAVLRLRTDPHSSLSVTNREGDGLTLIRWHREKAGTVEHAHHVLKNELAAAALPSGKFGANAA